MCQSQGIGHFFCLFPLFMTRSYAWNKGKGKGKGKEGNEGKGEGYKR